MNFLNDLKEHIDGTHNGHYSTEGEIQPIDLIKSKGVLSEFCYGSIIKYVTRFNKTKNLKDLLKAGHYLQMWYDSISIKEEITKCKDNPDYFINECCIESWPLSSKVIDENIEKPISPPPRTLKEDEQPIDITNPYYRVNKSDNCNHDLRKKSDTIKICAKCGTTWIWSDLLSGFWQKYIHREPFTPIWIDSLYYKAKELPKWE